MDKKTISQNVSYLETLQGLTNAYAEIASGRMKKIRKTVLSSRDFLDELNEIFQEVNLSYKKEVAKLSKKVKREGQITFLSHNGKTVSVFLSANTGLYGDLMPRTFDLFSKEIEKGETEGTLIGRLGLSLFLGRFPDRPYTYFEYPDYGDDKAKLGEIINHLVQYEAIHIFHGRFKSLISQEPSFFDISAETPISYSGQGKSDEKIKEAYYIFEPTLENILIFFETEMFTSVLQQAISESQLAKFASRMLSMDRASQNIQKNLGVMKIEGMRASHKLQNRKQLHSVITIFASGYSK